MLTTTAAPATSSVANNYQPLNPGISRIQSIDLLRGIVIILMTLDHVRDYFHGDAFLFNPTDLTQTSPAIFMTRWVTHFCAPVFVFLAGTSAYLVGQRKGQKELTSFLLKRGLWLVFVEFTIMNFAWFFNINFSLMVFQVIGALGVGMIILSFVSRLPLTAILISSIVIIAGHNLLDGIHVNGTNTLAILWAWIHEFKGFDLGGMTLLLGYPILPWTAIMMLGYCVGKLYSKSYSAEERKKVLLYSGFGMLGAFILIRATNVYGNPSNWTVHESALNTVFSFINVNKYPPSLLYALVTLGPALLFLAVSENIRASWTRPVLALGRAPLFFYITHVYLIHILAIFAALATGFEASDMVFNTWITDSPNLKGYGFSLPVVYGMWFLIVLMILPLCVRYDRYKTAHKEKWWLSYL